MWVTWQAWADETLHVLPVDDLIDHDAHDCVCGPTTVPVERTDGTVGFFVVHHSLDGREANEQR